VCVREGGFTRSPEVWKVGVCEGGWLHLFTRHKGPETDFEEALGSVQTLLRLKVQREKVMKSSDAKERRSPGPTRKQEVVKGTRGHGIQRKALQVPGTST
jgi:hypothetical protein